MMRMIRFMVAMTTMLTMWRVIIDLKMIDMRKK